MKISRNLLAVISLVIAALLFALAGVYIRMIGDSVGNFYQLFIRTAIMSLAFIAIGISFRQFKQIEKWDWPLFVIRGVLIMIDFFSFLYAVNSGLQLGLVLFLFYAANTLMNYIYGFVILREKFTHKSILAFVLALIGLGLIFANSFNSVELLPSILALISGTCFGLVSASSKNLTDKYSVTQVNLIAYVIVVILSFVGIVVDQETLASNLPVGVYLILTVFALTFVAAFYLMLWSYKNMEAQKASLILLSEIIFVTIIGFFLYQEVPTLNTILGGMFILAALIIPNINKEIKFKFFPATKNK